MAPQPPPKDFENPMLNITRTPDGSIKRDPIPSIPANHDPDGTDPVLTRDLPLNPNHKTWLRLYLPRQSIHGSHSAKLPVIFYYHGGGFILFRADSVPYHYFCAGMAPQLGAMVVSVDYRLAPDHRLPAAYEDAMDALYWIRNSQDDWILKYADLSNCYLMGGSAGANIVYHAGLRAASAPEDHLGPLKIKGLILHQPYFGGSDVTGSEKRLVDDPILPLRANHTMWDLSLPLGSDRNHEYCNPIPMVNGGGSTKIERVRDLGWRILVTGSHDDPLVDRSLEFAKMIESKGVWVRTEIGEGYHAVELFDPSIAMNFFATLKDFISSSE